MIFDVLKIKLLLNFTKMLKKYLIMLRKEREFNLPKAKTFLFLLIFYLILQTLFDLLVSGIYEILYIRSNQKPYGYDNL